MKRMGRTVLLFVTIWAAGCGDDKDNGANDKDAGAKDAGDNGGTTGGDDAGSGDIALDPKADADEAAASICSLAPWVLGKLSKQELPAAKITTKLRTEQAVFVADKPPICVDDPDAGADICDEEPSGATVFAFVYEGGADAGSDVEQVWCKSENFSDLARIKGAEGAKRGECEDLHALIVDWAEAQLETPSKRKIVYQADAKERGSEWVAGFVVAAEDGDTLTATSPELFVATKEIYAEENGGIDAVPSFLLNDIFGNHYCKLLSPAAALAWLSGG